MAKKTVEAIDPRDLIESDKLVERIEGVGLRVFGESWKSEIAPYLNVSRGTIFNWCKAPKNIPEIVPKSSTAMDERLAQVLEAGIVDMHKETASRERVMRDDAALLRRRAKR